MLVGTQMVAKGHDFPDVELGVVLDADATLRFPDFRAEERTFALIAQLAGRVGRGRRGRVLVQTIAPEARAIVAAARHDSDGFLAGELERRDALGYPPFAHLVRIVLASEQAAARRGPPRWRCASGCSIRAAGSPRRCSVRPRCSGCADASARCSSSRRPSPARRSPRSARRSRASRQTGRSTAGQLQRRRRPAIAPGAAGRRRGARCS